MKWSSSILAGALSAFALTSSALGAAVPPNAPVITENDPSVYYRADLQDKDNSTIRGHISAWAVEGEAGLKIHARFTGFPYGAQYYPYHIHIKPVPEDGNCYLTGTHLDPYGRTDKPPCDIKAPQTCEVGDLSGKHAPGFAPEGEEFDVYYTDFFLSNVAGTESFIGNRSFVVHAQDNARLNCGNFKKVEKLDKIDE